MADVAGNTITLRADAARQLRHSDPHGREMLISCGAFLFNARTAARRDSLTAVVKVLPDPDDELLVAEIALQPGSAPNTDELELSVAIARRTTSRVPFDDQPLFTDVLMSIQQAAQDEGAQLRLIQPSEPVREEVIGLVRRAEAIAAEDPADRAEEAAWTATDPGRSDGIPQDLLGPGAGDERAPVRQFHASTGSAQFERRTTLAVLSTAGDSARDWVAAGEALQHALLVATTYFVHASFATTVLEKPDHSSRPPASPVARRVTTDAHAAGVQPGAGAHASPLRAPRERAEHHVTDGSDGAGPA